MALGLCQNGSTHLKNQNARSFHYGRSASDNRIKLAADAQAGDQRLVTLFAFGFGVIQQLAALGHHHQQTTTGVVVFFVAFEVLGQSRDARCQNGNLYFGRTGIAFFGCVFFDQLGFQFWRNRHRVLHS